LFDNALHKQWFQRSAPCVSRALPKLKTKIQAIEQFQVPATKKEVRSFLGLTGYYRKFIPQYASISAPLSDLTRKTQPSRVNWTPECDIAFRKLKSLLCCGPVLRSPDFSRPFVLQTDASKRGVGAVLSQIDESGEEHPVGFYSRKLLPREQNYATIEKECLSIKLAVHAFRVYLLGRRFHIKTDHRSLEWLDQMRETSSRLTRWSLLLQPYQFDISYRCGKENANADTLSRFPVQGTSSLQERSDGV